MPDPAPRQPSQPPIEPGTVLAGKYRVERIIGQGGMGVVVEARHIALEDRVALKFLLPDHAQHPEGSARFLREARAAVKIKSEHVARVSDVGALETGAPYMVMEFLVGSDLARVLERQGTLALEDAIDYVVQGCEAIAEAHAHGIVHRDLKPANLFLTQRPDGSPLVKVLDFGISKVSDGGLENLTRTTAALGSALYMSPEQMQQTRSVDHRTDIYALGITLFELLAGRQPFYAETLPQLCFEVLQGTPVPLGAARPDLPAPFAAALERAYARDRAQRYQSIAEFVIAIAPFAPARSQPTIARVARMGGLTPPVAGIAGQRVSQPSPPHGSTPRGSTWDGDRRSPTPSHVEGTQPIAPLGFTPLSLAIGATPNPDAPRPGGTALLPGQDGNRLSPVPHALAPGAEPQIVLGRYSGPMSARAAATFASSTGMGVTTGARDRKKRSTALVVALLAAALLIGLGGGHLLLSPRDSEPVTGSAEPPQPAPHVTTAAPASPEPPRPAEQLVVPRVAPESAVEPATASAAAAPPRAAIGRPPPIKPPPSATPKPARTIDLNDPH